ncbi:MAG TPA: MarR family transcriptional regulator [Clostridium sp.]|nr:MarR family transcriptional regulator [Clostridium sp.]
MLEDKMKYEDLGDELYDLLAEFLNRRINRTVQDSIRGEYGVLRYLKFIQDNVTAGMLSEQLHVVPGRMTDILKSLENKGFIIRCRDEEDKRRVYVSITDIGRSEAEEKRKYIENEYKGLFEILSKEDTKELIRLLKIVLSYSSSIDI